MSRHIAWVTILALVAICLPVGAVPYVAGPYTVDVDVRNTTMALIPGSKVSCWLDGKIIRLKAKATGYVTQTATIKAGAATYYKHDFVLSDVEPVLAAVDMDGREIKAAYFEKGQYGFPANQYGITVYIPANQWPRPAQKRVQIVDGFWGATWKNEAKIDRIDEFYRVKVTMERKALSWGGPDFYVVFDTSKKVAHHSILNWFKRLARLERDPKAPAGSVGGLGEFLAGALPAREAKGSGEVPRTLQAYYDQADRFADLHRDSAEEPLEN